MSLCIARLTLIMLLQSLLNVRRVSNVKRLVQIRLKNINNKAF